MRNKPLLYLTVAAFWAASVTAPATACADMADTAKPMTLKLALAARCINHMKAYRQAIHFLDKQLEKSPPAVTYTMADGKRITLLNRMHALMRSDRRVLEAGMESRERACAKAMLS